MRAGLTEPSDEPRVDNVVHWTAMRAGGHFAALERPDLMLADLRAFVATISRNPS